MLKCFYRYFPFLCLFFFVPLCLPSHSNATATAPVSPATSRSLLLPALSPDEIINKMQQKFSSKKIKILKYNETIIISSQTPANAAKGYMDFKSKHSKVKLQYFYKFPDEHKIKVLSSTVKLPELLDPNKIEALSMDENWSKKIKSVYKLLLGKSEIIGKRKCYVLELLPKNFESKEIIPARWHIDSEKFIILKFYTIHKMRSATTTIMGEIFYKNINGIELPYKARWVTKNSRLPFIAYVNHAEYRNYKIVKK